MKKLPALAIAAVMAALIVPALTATSFAADDNADAAIAEKTAADPMADEDLAKDVLVSATTTKTKTVKMTVYKECYKKKNTVYCNTAAGIYKVNIKKKTKKLLDGNNGGFVAGIKLKGKYLYYDVHFGEDASIERVKKTGKSHKVLWSTSNDADNFNYAIKGKKMYFKWRNWEGKSYKKKMSLNGKNKKKTSYKAKTTYKKTNKKGYKIIYKGVGEKEDGYYSKYKCYLKTPSKKIYITTFEDDWGVVD